MAIKGTKGSKARVSKSIINQKSSNSNAIILQKKREKKVYPRKVEQKQNDDDDNDDEDDDDDELKRQVEQDWQKYLRSGDATPYNPTTASTWFQKSIGLKAAKTYQGQVAIETRNVLMNDDVGKTATDVRREVVGRLNWAENPNVSFHFPHLTCKIILPNSTGNHVTNKS